jgi:hypothetical protein
VQRIGFPFAEIRFVSCGVSLGAVAASDRGRRARGEKREKTADKWGPPPCGVHVSKTDHQNHLMIKNERV